MATKKSIPKSPRRTRLPEERKDLAPWRSSLEGISGRVYGRVLALQCALKTLEISDATDHDEDVGAAENLLRCVIRELNGLHDELDMLGGDLRFGRKPQPCAALARLGSGVRS